MTNHEAIQQLQYAPLAERIEAIELLLESFKCELVTVKPVSATDEPFRVRTFDLGADIQIDREEMYAFCPS